MRDFLLSPIGFVVMAGVVGFFLFGGLAFAFTSEYEKGGYESAHRRPKELKPWHVEPVPAELPNTQAPVRHRLETAREETTNLASYAPRVAAARAMLPMPVSRQPQRTMIEDGYHTRTAKRLREVEEDDEQEEGGEDRECGEDARRSFRYGEEGRAYTKQALEPSVTMWRNTITGEIVMTDEYGQRIEWDDGEEQYPS